VKPSRQRLSARIDSDVAALLQQAARRRNVATSVIVNAALHAYLAPEAGDDRESVITAHLERLSRQLQNTADKQDALQETMGLFVRIWFTYTPELPQADKRAANQSGAARFERFLEHLVDHLQPGRSIYEKAMRPIRIESDDFPADRKESC
jgi:predicted transcriptional regulator